MAGPEDHTTASDEAPNTLVARRLGIDSQHEDVVFMRADCHICRSEGFTAHSRIAVGFGRRTVIATLFQTTSDILAPGEAGLTDGACNRLGVGDGETVRLSHPPPLNSLRRVRGKVFGEFLDRTAAGEIIDDIVARRYSDIYLSSFITACSARPLNSGEMIALTSAMVDAGQRLEWPHHPVADKHCVGGLPGNRTTPIVVAIATACGLVMPKTSSRAITSPAGTADMMETLAPVELGIDAMRDVVDCEGGCIVWGGAVRLSPADDLLIRVERALDLDGEGQLVASVLSKKMAAGSSHVVLDIPVGPTAKIRTDATAKALAASLTSVADAFDISTRIVISDGSQPVGRGIGPSLEAEDVLAVLQGQSDAPTDLRDRAISLAGSLLELAGGTIRGCGSVVAAEALENGSAWAKFQRICEAQGGMRIPPRPSHERPVPTQKPGRVAAIDSRRLAKVAKLAGAPNAKAAGLKLHVKLGDEVEENQPLYTVCSESPGELSYAFEFVAKNDDIIETVEP